MVLPVLELFSSFADKVSEPDDYTQAQVTATAEDIPPTREDPAARPTQHQHGGLGKTYPGILTTPLSLS